MVAFNPKQRKPRKKESSDKSTLFIRDVPNTVKNRFKAWCAQRGLTMHDQIVEMMKQTIKKG